MAAGADIDFERFRLRRFVEHLIELGEVEVHGEPVALVVPPTANSVVEMGWGVAQTESRPINHQFLRPYPGPEGGEGGPFLPTPPWPSHTRQFGVYPVRGPW